VSEYLLILIVRADGRRACPRGRADHKNKIIDVFLTFHNCCCIFIGMVARERVRLTSSERNSWLLLRVVLFQVAVNDLNEDDHSSYVDPGSPYFFVFF